MKNTRLFAKKLIRKNRHPSNPNPVKGVSPKTQNRTADAGRNLYNRLVKHQETILTFAFIEPVPFTNNQAERDIRCVKIKQKVAMSFRTVKGAEIYARIQGFVSSTRKHNMNVFQQITMALNKEQILFKAV